MRQVVIVGGGIAGLACARFLSDLVPSARVVVLEAAGRAGGVLGSERVRGFTCEAAAHGFLNAHPSTLELALRCGLDSELLTGCEAMRRRFILDRGRLRRFPDSPATFLASDLLSLKARARMLLEPLVGPAREGIEESVGQFARRRLGREATQLLVEPVVTGIHAGDAEQLSVRAALPHLAALDGNGRSLLRAFLEARRDRAEEGPGASPVAIGRRRLVSFRDGMGSLPTAVAASLGAGLELGSPVRCVRREGPGFSVEVAGSRPREVRADAVVLALPARGVAACLPAIDPVVARGLRDMPTAPLATLALGFREADVPHALDGFGYLVTRREPGWVLGVYWSSSVFPGHRAPEGHVLLQAILGGARDPGAVERDDVALVEHACEQLRRALGITAAPVMVRTWRHPGGLPQYHVGHGARVAALEREISRHDGLFALGSAFRGIGVNACTADAQRVAEQVARLVGAREVEVGAGLPRAAARLD
jgi:oxygen-dependent protoporphyrinogen oxidase